MGSTKDSPQSAAIYCRISLDKAGEGLGVDRQRELCEKLAAEKGWAIAEVYSDNDTSAYSGKPRPAYERMLGDLEAGRRDALLVVDADRLTRRPVELERVIELADGHGIAMATVGGDLDLASSDGRLRARIMGAVARQESERKAERVAREAEQAARRGVPRGGQRPFGYEADRATIRSEEAELVQEAARRVLAGETTSAVARDWNCRRIPTPQRAAKGWSAASITGILRNPRVTGLRAHKGEVVAEGQWPAILERSTWEALQARIRKVSRPGRPASHLLSGIARCGRCKHPLWTSWSHREKGRRVARYSCIARPGYGGCGRVATVAAPLDELVKEAVVYLLSGPELAETRRQAASEGDEDAEASRELAEAEAKAEKLAEMWSAGEITRREWLAARDKIEERVSKATRVLDRRRGIPADLPDTEDALRAAWDDGDNDWRRALVTAVLETVVVKPVERPSPRFDPSRIELVRRV